MIAQERAEECRDVRERLLSELPVTDRQLQVAGVSTALMEGGEGPPIVFLQGEFGAVWLRVIPELVKTHHVIVPDLPGLGASQLSDGPPDLDAVLAWLRELIDKTCSSPPVLVGKGPGGALGLRFAIAHSDQLAHLALVDTHGLAKFRPPLGMALSFLRILVRPTEKGIDRSFRRYCYVDANRVQEGIGERWEWIREYALDRFRTPSVRAAMRRLMKDLGSPIPSDDLERIAVPTTLIWGRQDLAMRLDIAEAASKQHGWPLHVIDDARDEPAIEQPEAFLKALRTALASA